MASTPENLKFRKRTCCCGCCSLSTGTIVAAIICAIECVVGLCWNAELWMLLDGKEPLGIFKRRITFSALKDINVVHGLVIASTVLHVVWFILCGTVFRANIALARRVLMNWMLFVDLQTAFDIGATIYFVVKLEATSPGFRISELYNSSNDPTPALTYLVLMCLFSRGIVFWFINLYLGYVVQMRAKEIECNNSLMALYILSHMSTPRQQRNGDGCNNSNHQQPPPYYNPNYLPKYIVPRENLESSWDLNNEILENMSSFSNPLYPRIDQNSISDFRHVVSAPAHPPAYGHVVEAEQSYRHEGHGVLPY